MKNKLTFLNELHRTLDTHESLQNNLNKIITSGKEFLNYDYAGVLTFNGDVAKLSPRVLFPENEFKAVLSNSGVFGWIVDNKKSFIANNVMLESRIEYQHLTNLKKEKSFIGTPLIYNQNKIKGVFFTTSKESNFFAEEDLLILENLASMVVSILNFYEMREETIATMKQIDNELYSELRNTKRVMEKIVECSVTMTGAEHGCLLRYNDLKGQLETRYSGGCKKYCEIEEKKCTFKIEDSNRIASDVFRNETAKKINNIKKEGYLSNCAHNEKNIYSQAAVPLLGDSEKPFGVLILESMRESYFSNYHLELLKVLTEFGVTAFKNSKIFGKLEKLSEASNVLLKEYGSKTLKEKFDFIVKKTTELLDAEVCSLFLVEEKNVKLITSYSIEKSVGIKKVDELNVTLPILSKKGSGLTGAIAHSKEVFSAYGKELINNPAIKQADSSDFLPSHFCYSTISYPMLDEDGELIGLLKAYNKLGENREPLTNAGFSPEFDKQILKILTSKLIISIKNAEIVNELTKFKSIIENTRDPVVTTKMDGTVTYLNEGAIQLFGDIMDYKVLYVYYPDETSSGYDKAREVMRRLHESPTGSVTNYETVYFDKNGEPVPVSATFSLIKDSDDREVGTIGIVKDLRKTKELMEIGSALLLLPAIEKILEKISEVCLKFTKATRAYSKLYDEGTGRLLLRALKSKIHNDAFSVESTEIDEGITGQVFKTQKPIIVYEPSDKFCGLFKDVKSKIAVPINRIDSNTKEIKNFGVINVDSNQCNAFSINDMYFLTTIANQAAAAIENASLLTSKTKIINELTALENIEKTITKTLDIDSILDGVLDVVVDILGFDFATISKIKHSIGRIGTVKGRNVTQDFLNVAWHSLDSNDIQAWVVREKKEQKISGWDERLDREIYERYNHENFVRIFLPILSRDEAYGTLEAGYYKDNQNEITKEEIEILRKVVNLAGIGIDQSYLRKEQKLLGDQLQALNQANIYIQSSRNEKDVVFHTFKSLEKIGYSKGMLSLLNTTTGKIEGRYALGENWKKIINETKRELTSSDILAKAMREKRSILSKDCLSDPTCNQKAVQKANIKSQYVIPLVLDNEPMGTLQIDLSDQQGLVKKKEDILKRRMEVLETFASQIAIAIRNVRDRKMIDLLETTLSETAHEFRSPLHNILTQIGGLRSYLPKGFDKEKNIKNIYEIISDEANRAKRQMENTLLLSERSQGLLGFYFEENFIRDVIENCKSRYKIIALERGIPIIIKDNIKKLPKFKFDKQKIEQVINNILDNAVKYSHNSRNIQIQGFDDGTQIHVDIWDKGQGIPEAEFDKIFQGFVRSTYKDKKRYIPGTGLGLKIAKEIVEKHGGKIKVKSTPFFNDPRKIREYNGYDTIFTIILPKKPKEK